MIEADPKLVNASEGGSRRRLGRSDLMLSRLGLGSWAFGGPGWAYGWGPQDDDDSRATIRRAVELGINWVDTAALYGLGHAEEVVGRALVEIAVSERPYVFTKCGLPWKGRKVRHSLKADSIRREAEGSLARLGVERIDLYQIHWPELRPGGPAPAIEEGFRALLQLREEGKVRCIGVSNFDVPQLERIGAIEPPVSLQPPYSLVRPEAARDLLPYCLERDIGVVVYSPLESGLLTGRMTRERIQSLSADDWRRSKNEQFQEPALSRNLELVERLRRVASRRGRSPAEVAVAWTLRHPAVTGAIVGARRPDQIEALAGAAELDLSEEDLRELSPKSPS